MLKVPKTETREFRKFARRLGGAQTLFVQRRSLQRAEFSNCYNNVRDRVAKAGGSMLVGWAVREWPKVFLEAQQHCIWASDAGVIDVTPHELDEDTTAFVESSSSTFDKFGISQSVNRYHLLASGQTGELARQLIEVTTEKMTIELEGKKCVDGKLIQTFEKAKVAALLEQMKTVAQAIEWSME